MAGVIPRFTTGPVTYEVVEAVAGGKIVEARAAGKVGVAAAGSVKVLGVATKDSAPVASNSTTDAFGNKVLNINPVTQYCAVGVGFYPVTYAATATFGVALKAAANGQVTPWLSGTDAANLIIGYCAEPLGVNSGAVGLAKISR